ncbi:hypothetical protein KC365_g1686 [Hortaea werneckii]|nr:hypothetical protein KC365_g1686 [Hortaea werneckii]KAI7384428.1 hypothetical protein KC328_g10806 [Hortaea werneckii]
MNAGAGSHNTGKEEGASPSLDVSQHSAKKAGVEPPVSPSCHSETPGTSDDDATCSDDEPLLYTTPVAKYNTTQ